MVFNWEVHVHVLDIMDSKISTQLKKMQLME